MLKYVIVALCMLGAAQAASIEQKGVVPGIRNCGSNGQILQVRVTDCTALPCELITGNTYLVEIDFIPLETHPGLDLNVTLVHQGENFHLIDGAVENSAVIGGNRYTFAYPIDVQGFIQGESDLRIQITGSNSPFLLELCGIAEIRVLPPASHKFFYFF